MIETTKKIKLTQGKFAIVDAEDYDYLMQWKWYANKKRTGNWRAVRSDKSTGKRKKVHMSRQLMDCTYKDGKYVDHRNHNTLDSRRCNLRVCTASQNGMNRKKIKNSGSKFKGVCWDKRKKKWYVQIKVNGKQMYVGRFKNEVGAAMAYDKAANKYFKEFACLNFPSKK